MPAKAERPAVAARLVPAAQRARVVAARVVPRARAALVVRVVQRAKAVPPAPQAAVERLAAQAPRELREQPVRLAPRAAARMEARPMRVTHRPMVPSTRAATPTALRRVTRPAIGAIPEATPVFARATAAACRRFVLPLPVIPSVHRVRVRAHARRSRPRRQPARETRANWRERRRARTTASTRGAWIAIESSGKHALDSSAARIHRIAVTFCAVVSGLPVASCV